MKLLYILTCQHPHHKWRSGAQGARGMQLQSHPTVYETPDGLGPTRNPATSTLQSPPKVPITLKPDGSVEETKINKK